VDHGDHISIRTPSNPYFYWGNFVLFDAPPTAGCLPRWLAAFEDEVGRDLPHRILSWQGPGDGEHQQFLDAGFTLDRAHSLVATSVTRPPHVRDDLELRPIRGDAEWADATELQVETFTRKTGAETFARLQMRRYRALVDAGHGVQWGAFDGGRLAGTLGVFRLEAGAVARWQLIGTRPGFERQGVCRTLVHHTAVRALEDGAKQLVILADATYHAARVYQSVGFEPVEILTGAFRAQ
jgi:hypothetical protein